MGYERKQKMVWAVGGALGGVVMIATGDRALAQNGVEVIYSEVAGDPTAEIPGTVDEAGSPFFMEFKAFDGMNISPDGTMWIIEGRGIAGVNIDPIDNMLLIGSGNAGTTFAQESQPVHAGQPGERYDFFDGVAGINELNQYAFGARAKDGDPSIKEKIILFDGTNYSIPITESTPALGLMDLAPNPTGDEVFGNSLNGVHLLNDFTVGFVAVTINNIHSSRRPAIFYDDTSFRQSGVSTIGPSFWDSFDSDDFQTTPDGTTWYAQGDDEQVSGVDDILVVNDVVELREGSAVPGSAKTIDGIFHTDLARDGSWFTRGDDPSNDDWAVSNGSLIAETGGAVEPTLGPVENWGDVFLAFTGNAVGDYVLVGNTDNGDTATDTVVVFNNKVVLREGDPIDLNGDGVFDDDVFIGRGNDALSAFGADDLHLTDDLALYFIAPLRDGAGNDLGTFGAGGEAFMRMCLETCPEDCAGDNDMVNVDDLFAVVNAISTQDPTCDVTPIDAGCQGNGAVTFDDIVAVVNAFGNCPE